MEPCVEELKSGQARLGGRVIRFWKAKDMHHVLKLLSEDCESITKGVSIVEPDIDNNTATDESESNTGCSSRGTNLIPKKRTRRFSTFWTQVQKWDGSQKFRQFLDFVKQSYPRLGRRRLDNRMKQVAKSSTEVTTCSLVSEDN